MADAVGRRVAFFRDRQGLSAKDLADRCAALGMPSITRTVITKMENQRREAVSTAEAQVLAAALRIPPLALLLPFFQSAETEALPGTELPIRAAYEWFIGEAAISPENGATVPATGDAAVVSMWDLHHYTLTTLPQARMNVELNVQMAADPGLSADERRRAQQSVQMARQGYDFHVKDLQQQRAAMRAAGLTPPQISPELAAELGESES